MHIDIDAYRALVSPVRVDDIDFDAFRDEPLAPPVRQCLRYMHDVELHTVCYLRDLLVTSAHRDPTITTFLTFWSFEEYWHGAAISRVLAAHGEARGDADVRRLRRSRRVREGIQPLLHGAASAVSGRAIGAVHMTWGAVNEWTTQAGYSMLARRADHPVLSELLRRIMRQEGRHIDFYASQATDRLAGSRTAQRLTRLALRRFWAPVGSDLMGEDETRHLIGYLFDGDDGREMAARIDRRIDRLPGLSGLDLVMGARQIYVAPADHVLAA
ncbi:MAG: ferritin-like domain-containing protein [Acidimicrobiia bacterium]